MQEYTTSCFLFMFLELTEPIDIYHEWIDKAEKVNNEKDLGGDSIED